MRKFTYLAVITAAVLLIAGLVARSPQPATASAPAQASSVMTAYDVQATIDVTALPVVDINIHD